MKDKGELIPASEGVYDCARHGDKVIAEVEKAYRRGFVQGAAVCMYSIRDDGASMAQIEKWVMRLMDWRRKSRLWRKGQTVKAECPPEEPCA